MGMPEYKYEALPSVQHIRLLRIQPGASEEYIAIETVTARLDEAQNFYCLSYSWGDSVLKRAILVNALGTLHVSETLFEALLRLRELYLEDHIVLDYGDHKYGDDCAAMVWIDQICINQRDLQERSHQVAIMGEIYSRSVRTLIWLGEEDAYVGAENFRFIEGLAQAEAERRQEGKAVSSRFPDQASMKSNLYTQIFNRRWFSRAWVIQETVKSQQDPLIICGSSRIAWQVLSDAVSLKHSLERWNEEASDWVCVDYINMLRSPADTMTTRSPMRPPLLWAPHTLLAQSAWYFDSSDPRDKVYATLALRPHGIRGTYDFGEIVPDYSKPYLTVYRDAVLNAVHSSKSWLILSDGPPLPDEPCDAGACALELTWVPRWEQPVSAWRKGRKRITSQDQEVRLAPGVASTVLPRTTSLGLPADITFCGDDNLLKLRAIRIGTVLWCSKPVADWSTKKTPLLEIWEDMLREAHIDSDFGTKHLNIARKFAWCWLRADGVFSHVITDDMVESLYDESDESLLVDFWACLAKCYERKRGSRPVDESLIAEYKLRGQLDHSPTGACTENPKPPRRMKFFITSDGDVGYGSVAMRPSDVIFVFFGSPFAALLRECGSAHHFLGDACLPNYLDGHVVKEFQDQQRDAEWLTIR